MTNNTTEPKEADRKSAESSEATAAAKEGTEPGAGQEPNPDGGSDPNSDLESKRDSESGRDAEDDTDPPAEPDSLGALKSEVISLKDQLLRALADAENTRRRAERERKDVTRYAVTEFARDMLTVADNLRRALDAMPASDTIKDETARNMVLGVEMTERELLRLLDKHGIRKIEPLDEPFDYNFHQAMFEKEDTGKPAGTVAQVLQSGYTIHDRLLRAAMVVVAKGGDREAPSVDTTV